MANSYAAHTFSIDVSTNVAGLAALKGAPCDASDAIVVTGAATLTIDAGLTCGSITGSYTVSAGGLRIQPASATAVALCTLEQVKERRRIKTTENDALIARLIPKAQRRLQIRTGREFMPQVTATRTFDFWNSRVRLASYDLLPASQADPVTVVLHPELEHVALTEGTDYELEIDPLTGTAGVIILGSHLCLYSHRAAAFGRARLEVTGGWGIWADLSEVAEDVNFAAIETVLAGIEAPVTDLSGIDIGTPRGFQPGRGAGWDIPIDAWRAIQAYDRNLGVG